jgi:DNA primase
MIPDHVLQQIRESSEEVFVEILGEVGRPTTAGNRSAKCPLGTHNDTSPSFSFNPDKGLWHCFSCGSRGDVFALVQEALGLGFVDAVKHAAEIAGVTIFSVRVVNPNAPEAVRRRNQKRIMQAVVEWHRQESIRSANQFRRVSKRIRDYENTRFDNPDLERWRVKRISDLKANLPVLEEKCDKLAEADSLSKKGRLLYEHWKESQGERSR